MSTAANILTALSKDESGQDLIEYALVAAVVALGVITSMSTLATAIANSLAALGTSLTSAI